MIHHRIFGFAALAFAAAASPCLAASAGPQVFADNCAACHQPMGQGVPGAFPPLVGNAVVQGEPAPLSVTVLQGRGGMPAFIGDLSDSQIADVLTYIRSSWGNKAGPVTPEMVAAARAGLDPGASRKTLEAH